MNFITFLLLAFHFYWLCDYDTFWAHLTLKLTISPHICPNDLLHGSRNIWSEVFWKYFAWVTATNIILILKCLLLWYNCISNFIESLFMTIKEVQSTVYGQNVFCFATLRPNKKGSKGWKWALWPYLSIKT